jgi:type II secretory pathway component PulK
VNTAPPEVLAALVKSRLSQATALVARRKTASFRTMEGFTEQLYGGELARRSRAARYDGRQERPISWCRAGSGWTARRSTPRR